jgi:hypothetical protein
VSCAGRTIPRISACFLVSFTWAARAAADAPSPEDFFENRIRPVLVDRCSKCHAADQHKGGLSVDSRAALLKGGDTGPAIAPGRPDQSLLIKAVRGDDKDLRMPPEKDGPGLTAAQIADLT